MKHILYTAVLSLSALTVTTLSLHAQAPAIEKEASQSTGQLTVQTLNHTLNVFSTAASAKDKQSAELAAATIQQEIKRIDSLTPLLAKAAIPTETEMKQVAEATAKIEVSMQKQLEQLGRNLKNREVRSILDPAMKTYAKRSSSIMAHIDRLYPAAQMQPLVKAAKTRIQLKKSEK